MRSWRYFIAFLFTLGLFIPVSAARIVIDVCDQNSNDFLEKQLIVLTGQVEKRTEDKFDTRLLTVDRVLSGNVTYKQGETLTLILDGMFDDYLAEPGKYLLLLERFDDGKLHLSDYSIIILGPVIHCLSLKSFDDPIISDVQIVVDTLSIPSDEARWERITTLWPRMKYRPFVQECFLRAMASQYHAAEHNYFDYLQHIFDKPNEFHPSTVLFADQLRRGINPMHPVPSLHDWIVTDEQLDLMEGMAAELSADDPNREYLRIPLTAGMKETRRSLTTAEAQCLRDVYATDVWPMAAVVDFPQVAEGAQRCTVNVEKVISGEPVLTAGKQEMSLSRSAKFPPAGKYIMFLTRDYNKNNQQIPKYGDKIFVLGSVINYHPVASVDDPAVEDIRTLILFSREPEVAIWKSLRNDALKVKEHPLLENFNLRQAALRASIMEKTFDQAALEILRNPKDYPLPFVVLTDGLFTAPEWPKEPISDAASKWKKSPERKELFTDMQRRLTDADDKAPYYSRFHVNEVLKEFEPKP